LVQENYGEEKFCIKTSIIIIIIIIIMTISNSLYCSGNHIEKNEMGGACSTYGRRSVYRVLVGKPKGKRTLRRPSRR